MITDDLREVSLKNRLFIGSVVNKKDLFKIKRVQIRIPELHENVSDENLPWAIKSDNSPFGNGPAFNSVGVPEIGTDLLIIFENGDRASPIYLGTLTTKKSLGESNKTEYETYGLIDKVGNSFLVDMATKEIEVKHFTGTVIKIEPSGKITMEASDDISAEGKTINVIGTAEITLTAPLINFKN